MAGMGKDAERDMVHRAAQTSDERGRGIGRRDAIEAESERASEGLFPVDVRSKARYCRKLDTTFIVWIKKYGQ